MTHVWGQVWTGLNLSQLPDVERPELLERHGIGAVDVIELLRALAASVGEDGEDGRHAATRVPARVVWWVRQEQAVSGQ